MERMTQHGCLWESCGGQPMSLERQGWGQTLCRWQAARVSVSCAQGWGSWRARSMLVPRAIPFPSSATWKEAFQKEPCYARVVHWL